MNIKLKETLDLTDYEEINGLQKLCSEYDRTALKLELDFKRKRGEIQNDSTDRINEFLYYADSRLVGYLGVCLFGGGVPEINGMVHPDYRRRGIFTNLFARFKDELEQRHWEHALLLCDRNSVSGQEFMKTTGAAYDQSEYEMYLQDGFTADGYGKRVTLRKAVNQDAMEIARQNAIYFEEDLREEDVLMPEEEERYGSLIFMAAADGKTIGKVHLEVMDTAGGIYGLGVLPEYREKGYGREILLQAVDRLLKTGAETVMLQVAVKNERALNIYRSCGFEITSTMDYFELRGRGKASQTIRRE